MASENGRCKEKKEGALNDQVQRSASSVEDSRSCWALLTTTVLSRPLAAFSKAR